MKDKMKKTKLKLVSLALAALAVIPLALTGCKPAAEPAVEPVKAKVTNVYKSTDIPMDKILGETTENGNTYISQMYYSNGSIYIMKEKYNYDTGDQQKLLCQMSETGDILSEKEIKIVPPEDSGDHASENGNSGGYLNNVMPAPDGGMLCTYSTWYSDEYTYESENYLIWLDADGNETMRKSAKELFPDLSDIYLNNIVYDAAGNLVVDISGSSEIAVIGKDASVLFTVPYTGYIQAMQNISGKIYVTLYEDSSSGIVGDVKVSGDGTKQYVLDTDAKKLIASDVTFPSNVSMYNIVSGEGYDIYYTDQNRTAIFGYNFGDTEPTELMNFINSDMSSDNIGSYIVISKDKFLCRGYDNITYEEKLMMLDRIPDDQVKEKVIVTVASVYSDYELRNQIIGFNKSSDTYRIQIKDYSKYAVDYDYSAAYTQLNNDIVAGKMSDIIIISEDDMPVDSYNSKGLFLDLNTMFENDTDIKRSDFLENIFDAFEFDGKLYQFINRFNVQTIAGKKSVLGDKSSWTMAEMRAFINSHSEARAFYDMTKKSAIALCCNNTIDDFIDPVTGQCKFDSQEFIDILEFANTLSETSIWENYDWNEDDGSFWEDYENMYRNGTTLLQSDAYISSFMSYWYLVRDTFGEDVNLIGYPVSEGNGSLVQPSIILSVAAKAASKDGAWAFIKYLLSDDVQTANSYGLPLKLSALEAQAENAMKEEENTYYPGGLVYNGMATYDLSSSVMSAVADTVSADAAVDAAADATADTATTDTAATDAADDTGSDVITGEEDIEKPVEPDPTEISNKPMTKEAADYFMNFLKSLNKRSSTNSAVYDVINEEVEAFFAGQKTASETAKIIQNRVQIVVSEQR